MCGIAGVSSSKPVDNLNEVIQDMINVIPHRGPDGEGVFLDNEVIGLGHKRLSIIDVSEAANQPMISNCRNFVMVFNGEIYNYREIRSQIKDYNFKTQSDSEVLLAAYIKWGRLCLDKLNGMFAFAIYDKNKRSLFLSRDRMGIKPLYFIKNRNIFAFASEIKQLLNSGFVEKKLDNQGLVQYFKNKSVYSPNTIFAGVKMLQPGHYIYCDPHRFEIESYWNLLAQHDETICTFSRDKTQRDIYELLQDSVRLRLISDVPLGVFLSGGIDSSILVGIASQIANVNTLSVTFDEENYDESKYSQIIAQKFQTNHTEIKVSSNDLLNELPSIMNAMDHPTIDGINAHYISKKASKEGLKVSLSGLGGDELFAGYDYFKWGFYYKKYLERLPSAGSNLKHFIGNTLMANSNKVWSNKMREYFKVTNSFQSKYHILRQLYFSHQLDSLFNFEPNSYPHEQADIESLEKFPILSQFSYFELTTYTQNVLLRDIDQMSMNSSLEIRVPFLDHRLIEYVMNVSDKLKFPDPAKKLLIESTGDLLPPDIYNRKKMGFNLPMQEWMRNEIKDFCSERIHSLSSRQEFNASFVLKNWDDFLNDKNGVSYSRIWAFVALESTLQNYGL